MSYQVTTGDTLIRLSDHAMIPTDAGNRDYRAYLDWLSEGHAPDPQFSAEDLLANARALKITAIAMAFEAELKQGFTTSSGIKMDAGIEAIQLFKSAYDLLVLLGRTHFPVVVDFNNAVHPDMPIAGALTMMIETGINYQTWYGKKQALRGQAQAAETLAELDSIAW